jgi:peptide/nickel transport system substrate-binding protein
MNFRLRPALWAVILVGCVATLAPSRLVAQGSSRGELHVALSEEPANLNPVVGTLAVESDIAALVFSGLTRYDEKGNQVPDLAQRVPTLANGGISADGKTITYHLVRNARWHDGVPLTSADVKFTFDALMNPKNNVVDREPYDEMQRVETPDPYTVRIVLKRPWAPAVYGFGNGIDGSIVPAHLLGKLADLNHADFNALPVGSGPYKLVAWHHGSDMVFAADPAYFRGVAKIPRIVVRFLENDNTMMIALRTHEVDIGDTLNIAAFIQLRAVAGMVSAVTAKTYWEHLTFNTSRAPLDDRRVRLALCSAIDVQQIFADVFHHLGALGPTSINPETPWYNRRVTDYPFDPRRAAALLDDAGWKLGTDGIRTRNGKRLELTFISTAGNVTRAQTMVLLQQRWRDIGADVSLKTFPPATMFAQAANGGPFYGGKFDIALSAFIAPNPDPNQLNVNRQNELPPAGNNLSFYRNAELSALEDSAAGTYNFAARKRLYDRIQEIVRRDVPYYTLNWLPLTDVRRVDLDGVKPPIVNSTFWNIATWQYRAVPAGVDTHQ